MSILLHHLDLVEAVATEHDVSFSLLQDLLKREEDFASAAANGHPIDLPGTTETVEKTVAAPANTGSPSLLRLVSLATENMIPSSNQTATAPTPEAAWTAIHRSYWSPAKVLKLLLVGTTDDDVRVVGFPPIWLNRDDFVGGRVGIWPGLLQPDRSSENSRACIVAEFDGTSGRIEIERSWRPEGTGWREEVGIREDGRWLTGQDADAWLCCVAPPEAVPLFVFDSSDVWASMLSSTWRRRAMSRLYPSAFLAALATSLRERHLLESEPAVSRNPSPCLDIELEQVRRRRNAAEQIQSEIRIEIRALQADLAEAEGAQKRMRDLFETPPPSSERRRGGLGITIPEPLGVSREDVGARRPEEVPSYVRHAVVERHLLQRLADLGAKVDRLRAAIEAARLDAGKWEELAEVCSWQHRAHTAELALAAANRLTAVAANRSEQLGSCLVDLGERLRRLACERLVLAFQSRASSLDLPPGFTYEFEFDDEGGFRLWPEPELSNGSRAFVQERAALLLMNALQEASGSSMPVVASLDPSDLDGRNLTWLRRHLPSIATGQVVLTGDATVETRAEEDRARFLLLYIEVDEA